MGMFMSRLQYMFSDFISTGNTAKILMIGLDAAGKTTILYKIKLNQQVSTLPTIGFNVENVEPMRGISFTVWDVGGQEKIRRLWEHYYRDTDGLVFVVDSTDRQRLAEARDELVDVIRSDEMKDVPILVLANKQDMPCAMAPYELIEQLELRELGPSRKWHVQGTCATSGEGIFEGMEVMATMVKQCKKSRSFY